jgi:uncharacterized protein with LGFP repeats
VEIKCSGKSPVGYPVSDMTENVGPTTAFQTFKFGAISMLAGGPDSLGGFPVMIYGNIYLKWLALGGVTSGIGVPIIDESPGADKSRYNTFSNGAAIYWTNGGGAHVIMGVVYQKYLEVGADTGFLGIPTTDELSEGKGRYNDFVGGFIYFSTVTGLAHAVKGGLPPSIGPLVQQYSFKSGVAAGGSSNITVFQNGQVQFEGQLHDSGALAYDISVVCILVDADNQGYSLTTVGHIAGTFESGSRDYLWNTSANNGLIQQNWRAIVASNSVAQNASESMDLGALMSNVANAAGVVGAAAGVIALL